MDVVDNAIKKGYHVNNIPELSKTGWDDFEKAVSGRELFLYGIGDAIPFLWERYGKSLCVTGCIDNNDEVQGEAWELRCAHFSHPVIYEERVCGREILNKYDESNVVILILSIRHYEEIYRSLINEGYDNVFSFLTMEIKERIDKKINEKEDVTIRWLEEDRSLPVIKKKILVQIGVHGGHGKAITKELLKNDASLEIVWLVNRYMEDVPENVRVVHEMNLYDYYYEINTARILIIDVVWNPPKYIKKGGQIIIQVKHWGSITLKKFGVEETGVEEDYGRRLRDSQTWDYILTGSRFDEESCGSGFPGKAKCINVGSPRSDILFDEEIKGSVYRRLGININCRALMYAPTFRAKDGQPVKPDTEIDLYNIYEKLQARFYGKWKILIRLHPVLAHLSWTAGLPDFCIDVSKYEDIQELVAASDCMISDYSSVMFEHAYVNRPVFLFSPDRERYVGKEKDLLLDYDSLPFPIAETNDQLAENILNFDQEKYEADVTAFLDKYGVHEDGHASERAADFILGLLEDQTVNFL